MRRERYTLFIMFLLYHFCFVSWPAKQLKQLQSSLKCSGSKNQKILIGCYFGRLLNPKTQCSWQQIGAQTLRSPWYWSKRKRDVWVEWDGQQYLYFYSSGSPLLSASFDILETKCESSPLWLKTREWELVRSLSQDLCVWPRLSSFICRAWPPGCQLREAAKGE